MSDPDVETGPVTPGGDEQTGATNRRGRGVFAAVLLLLLLLCAVTTITQTYVTAGSDQVIKSAFGPELSQLLIDFHADEWARFCGHVTDWERQMYWDDTP